MLSPPSAGVEDKQVASRALWGEMREGGRERCKHDHYQPCPECYAASGSRLIHSRNIEFPGKDSFSFLSRNKSEAFIYSQCPCQAGHKVQNKVWDTIIDLGALML